MIWVPKEEIYVLDIYVVLKPGMIHTNMNDFGKNNFGCHRTMIPKQIKVRETGMLSCV